MSICACAYFFRGSSSSARSGTDNGCSSASLSSFAFFIQFPNVASLILRLFATSDTDRPESSTSLTD
ncbi:hypothetical protein FDG2_2063 [Candidatus Protofrankia californiensis]|uniref:Secreted protein n=1 Tax=Candidatus Protofrankia californiensis TaxID=1839754 RepID=A0A1C3NWW5_9ACTN|nr:hypothetical protein FDG2_2063 [Candidatus Protofrankia californiensis]